MSTIPERGFLAIADLTGYTSYLSRGEIEHAPAIAGDLIETIVARLEPPFRLAKLEGDAAFLFVEDGRADGSLLLDALEAAYVAFRRRLLSLRAATACTCIACGLAPELELKLFLHHGAFVRSRIAGRDELAGSDVILVHRLLKGTTADRLREESGAARGFALLTADAVAALALDGSGAGRTFVESVEPFGEVTVHHVDLDARWQAERERRRIDIAEDAAWLDVSVEVPAPPAETWAQLTVPDLRSAWEGGLVMLDGDPGRARGVGTIARCVTGSFASVEEIVDWQPYDHVGYRLTVPELGRIDAAYDLTPGAHGGTAVRLRWTAPAAVEPRGHRAGSSVATGTADRFLAERRRALGRLARQLAGPGSETALEVAP
jgi:uncharacterized protein YndB with AHSA1/START domain